MPPPGIRDDGHLGIDRLRSGRFAMGADYVMQRPHGISPGREGTPLPGRVPLSDLAGPGHIEHAQGAGVLIDVI